MPPTTQSGARVIYVANSTREFPDQLQHWLSNQHLRAIACSSVYEALALLTRRNRPAAVIVSPRCVDWDEMEFFSLAIRLSRSTTLYIADDPSCRDKIEAACAQGARIFSAEEIEDDGRTLVETNPTVVSDLLAGRLDHSISPPRTSARPAVPRDDLRIVPDDSEDTVEQASAGPEATPNSPVPPAGPQGGTPSALNTIEHPAPTSANHGRLALTDAGDSIQHKTPPSIASGKTESLPGEGRVRLVPPEPPEPTDWPETAEAAGATALTEPATVLLHNKPSTATGSAESIHTTDPAESTNPADPAQSAPAVVPVPWSPAPNRPRRTPPAKAQSPAPIHRDPPNSRQNKTYDMSGEEITKTERAAPPADTAGPAEPARTPELTPDELAALLGRPRSRRAKDGAS